MVASVASMIGSFNRNNIAIMQDMGYEVHVACNFKDISVWPKDRIKDFVRQLNDIKVHYHQVDFSRSPKNVKKVGRSFLQVDTLVSKFDFDFVHCHTPLASAIVRVICHRRGVKVIYTAHGFHFYDGAPVKNWLLYYPVEKWLSRFTDILITINREDYRRAKEKFHAGKTVYVPGVGIDMEKFRCGLASRQDKRKGLGLSEDDVMLLSVGELSPRKNHKAAVRAIAKFQDIHMHYFIAGQGEMETEMDGFVRQLGLDGQVHLLGYRTDILELCQAADLFVFPSLQEGLPVALMEAIACKTLAICSNIRGNTDLISDSRFLFDAKEIDSIRRCMEYALRLGKGGKESAVDTNYRHLRAFSLKSVSRRMEEIYVMPN